MDDFLYTLGIIQSSVVGDALEDIYFYDWQIGSQEDMTPGLVDVSIFGTYAATIPDHLAKNILVWRRLHAKGPRVPDGAGELQVQRFLLLPN